VRYLLDTNIVSVLVRDPQGALTERVRAIGDKNVCTSIIVAAELRYGATKKGSLRLTAQLEAVLGALEVVPFEPPADAIYGDIRVQLERRGKPVGGNDLLIAAHALALGCTVVTDSEREFGRVQKLEVENWLRGGSDPEGAKE
jgi:tRNA(fMet)-specific endonuclease VapC